MARPILDDELWKLVEPLLPPPKKRRRRNPGRKPKDNRSVLTGILFVLKTGIPWEYLPKEMGCGSGMAWLPTTCTSSASRELGTLRPKRGSRSPKSLVLPCLSAGKRPARPAARLWSFRRSIARTLHSLAFPRGS